MKKYKCEISGKELPLSQLIKLSTLRPSLLNVIMEENPGINSDGYISIEAVKKARYDYFQKLMTAEIGEVSSLENEVIESLSNSEVLSRNIEPDMERRLTFGEKVSDKLATFGGSWKFILSFIFLMILWIAVNVYFLADRAFDPFPFILLNLCLSCLAAIQAPIILMSQNRQEDKDRTRAEHDYQVNLKAEIEIKHLHEKIDHILVKQWQRLIEVQEEQMDILEEILVSIKK